MPDEHQLSSSELCDLLLATGSPSIWAEMNAALTTIAQRHGLIEATADKRTFVLKITTDCPDGETSARKAADLAACQVGWGDDNTSSIELTEVTGTDHPTHLARWDFEPGSQSEVSDA